MGVEGPWALVETEPTRLCAVLVDLPDVSVIGVDTSGPRVRAVVVDAFVVVPLAHLYASTPQGVEREPPAVGFEAAPCDG